MWLLPHMLARVICGSAGAVWVMFFGGVAQPRHFFIEVIPVFRKVWIAMLTVLTVVFIVTLLILSKPKPTVWMTDQEVDALVYQDMLEKGFIDPTTGEIN